MSSNHATAPLPIPLTQHHTGEWHHSGRHHSSELNKISQRGSTNWRRSNPVSVGDPAHGTPRGTARRRRAGSPTRVLLALLGLVLVVGLVVVTVVLLQSDTADSDDAARGAVGATSGTPDGGTSTSAPGTSTPVPQGTSTIASVPTPSPTLLPTAAPTLPPLSPTVYIAPPAYTNPHIDWLESEGAFATVRANAIKEDVRQCFQYRDTSVLLRNASCSNAKYGLRLEGDAGPGKYHAVQNYTFTDWARYDAYGAGIFLGGKSSEYPLVNPVFMSVLNVSVNLDWDSYSTTNVDGITNDGATSADGRVYVEYARISRGADGAIDVKGPMSFSRSYFHATKTNRLIRAWGSVGSIYFSHCVFESTRALFWVQNSDVTVYYHNCLFNGGDTVTAAMMDGDTGCGVSCFQKLDTDPLPSQHAFFANDGA